MVDATTASRNRRIWLKIPREMLPARARKQQSPGPRSPLEIDSNRHRKWRRTGIADEPVRTAPQQKRRPDGSGDAGRSSADGFAGDHPPESHLTDERWTV